jgi:hypothetical protein
MRTCSGNDLHTVTITCQGIVMLATHAADDAPPALVPCVDYQVTRDGQPAGSLVSLNDNGNPPYNVFNVAGNWVREVSFLTAGLKALSGT